MAALNPALKELSWGGWVMKKAFKTLTKQSWKRRWCQFDPDTLTISWHAGEGSKALGEFTIDPLLVLAQPSVDHSNPNEFKVESKGQVFYAYTEAVEERTKLLQRIDAARRVKLAGDDGSTLVRSDAAKVEMTSDSGRKVFCWGVGIMLGNGNTSTQAWAMPSMVNSLKYPFSASEVLSGPEHSACLSSDGDVHLWGSNEFQQAGVAGPTAVFKPVPLGSLGTRKVLSIACGGSHTLAVVADALDADGGAVVGWGTGTVGQLGLGQSHLLSNEPLVIPMPEIHGHPVPVRKVATGLVTSAAILSTGELFVWGDASLGRLGLPDIPDSLTPTGQPVLVNGKVIWTPQQLDFRAVPGLDLGKNFQDKRIVVANVGLGGSFSLYLLHAGEGTGPGGVLLMSGALGIDITKDRYGYPEEVSGASAALDLKLEDEIKSVPRNLVPKVVAPFGNKPIVLSISAGARHAGVVAQEATKGNAPRAFTGGKGWLAHAGDGDSMLLPKPAITSHFAPVVGILGDEDAVDIICGHSHTLVKTSDGRLYTWGRGDSGELGQGNLTDRTLPAQARLPDGHCWTCASAGSYYSVAVAEPGAPVRKTPAEVNALFEAKYKAIAAAQDTAVAKYTGGGEQQPGDDSQPADSGEAAEGGGGGGGESDPNALPAGWDYEYTADGQIYFIAPDGSTTWDDPRG